MKNFLLPNVLWRAENECMDFTCHFGFIFGLSGGWEALSMLSGYLHVFNSLLLYSISLGYFYHKNDLSFRTLCTFNVSD